MNEARVEEQSHKSEMRAALRGDFERLQARRQTEGSTASERSEPDPQATAARPTDVPAPAPAHRSWLERLRGHR